MKLSTSWLICLLGGVLAGSAVSTVSAEAGPNPYQAIVERNPFGLKPPPPPPDPTPVTPVTPPSKVVLTGFTTMFGPPRALLEITDQEAGKTAATTRRPIMREGDRDGSVEVVSIDVEKNLVQIRNAGVETNITFDVPKLATGASGAPGAPGAPGFRPGFPPGPLTTGMPQTPAGASPGNPAANNAARGSGVSLFGASAATPPAFPRTTFPGAPAGGAPAAGASPLYGTAATPGAEGTGLRTIPSRTLRSDGSRSFPVPPPAPAN